MSNRAIYLPLVCLSCAAVFLCGVGESKIAGQAIAAADNGLNSQRFSPPAREDAVGEEQLRLREGAKITGRSGVFRHDGEGATFVTTDGYELSALPNLNLERIVRTLKSSDEANTIRWSVDGLVTEFNGRNYLLISRAVYKSSAPPPPPEQLAN